MTRPEHPARGAAAARRHRRSRLGVRPVRVALFGLATTLSVLALVASIGLVPESAVARSGGPVDSPAAADDWSPVASLADVGRRLEAAGTGSHERSGDRLAVRPPDRSGQGRRIVLDLSAQQVWLVRSGGSVARTYLVSGSRYDNLRPGRYDVYSRSRNATSFDYSSTMRWMVRFTQGPQAAIGFHDIPRDSSGEPVQTWDRLGTPTSAGCVRQRPRDARALWRFAPVGTPVAVVA